MKVPNVARAIISIPMIARVKACILLRVGHVEKVVHYTGVAAAEVILVEAGQTSEVECSVVVS